MSAAQTERITELERQLADVVRDNGSLGRDVNREREKNEDLLKRARRELDNLDRDIKEAREERDVERTGHDAARRALYEMTRDRDWWHSEALDLAEKLADVRRRKARE
jgi:hypothetical protein